MSCTCHQSSASRSISRCDFPFPPSHTCSGSPPVGVAPGLVPEVGHSTLRVTVLGSRVGNGSVVPVLGPCCLFDDLSFMGWKGQLLLLQRQNGRSTRDTPLCGGFSYSIGRCVATGMICHTPWCSGSTSRSQTA